YVDNKAIIDGTLELVQEDSALIGFILVDPELSNYMNQRAKGLAVDVIDVMGPMMKSMDKVFSNEPLVEHASISILDKDYFKRIEAIEFAVRYDDGRDPRGIARADIVLLGVSRTSKTPLSQYLAHQRLKVANVPLVPEVDPPEELFQINPE